MLHQEIRSHQGKLPHLSTNKGPNQSILTILNSLLLLSNHIEVKTFFLSKPAPPLCSRFHPLPFHLFLSFLCTGSLFSANKHAPRSLIIKSTNHKTKLSLNPTYSSRHSPISLFPFILNYSKELFTYVESTF